MLCFSLPLPCPLLPFIFPSSSFPSTSSCSPFSSLRSLLLPFSHSLFLPLAFPIPSSVLSYSLPFSFSSISLPISFLSLRVLPYLFLSLHLPFCPISFFFPLNLSDFLLFHLSSSSLTSPASQPFHSLLPVPPTLPSPSSSPIVPMLRAFLFLPHPTRLTRVYYPLFHSFSPLRLVIHVLLYLSIPSSFSLSSTSSTPRG